MTLTQHGEYFYDTRRLNLWFGVSNVLLLVSVVWMVHADWDREWKGYQRDFKSLERARAQGELGREAERLRSEHGVGPEDLDARSAQVEARRREIVASQEHRALALRGDELEPRHFRANQDYLFKKSVYDAEKFYYEEALARHGPEDPHTAEARSRMDGTAEKLAGLLAAREALEAEQGEVRARQEGLLAEVERERIEVERLRRDYDRLQRRLRALAPGLVNDVLRDAPLLDFLVPSLKVRNTVLPRLRDNYFFTTVQKEDRCQTCHLAIDSPAFRRSADGLFEDPHLRARVSEMAGGDEARGLATTAVYAAHPRLDLMVADGAVHPAGRFGCTICHEGMPQATTFLLSEHTPSVSDGGVRSAEWFRRHGWEEPWKYHFSKVAIWDYPMRPPETTEGGCLVCHQGGVEFYEDAPTLARGQQLFIDLGCHGCHKTRGFEGLRKVGPDLRRLAAKVDLDWVRRWLRNPAQFRADTRMPSFFGVDPEAHPEQDAVEIEAVAQWLYQASQDFIAREGFALQEPGPAGDPARGRTLVEEVGCLGCHRVGALGRDLARGHRFGPDLAQVGAKTSLGWLQDWLKDPTHYYPGTRMPSLRLDDQEAADVAAYLASLREVSDPAGFSTPLAPVDRALRDSMLGDLLAKRGRATFEEQLRGLGAAEQERLRTLELGERLLSNRGCFGCHLIPGYEQTPGIGTELSSHGYKDADKLDFGAISEYWQQRLGDPHYHFPHDRRYWFAQKLADPRVFDWRRERRWDERLRMPRFGLGEDEVAALVTFLTGLTGRELHPEYRYTPSPGRKAVLDGLRLVRERNCVGCHVLEGEEVWFRHQGDTYRAVGAVKEAGGKVRVTLWEPVQRPRGGAVSAELAGRHVKDTLRLDPADVERRVPALGGEVYAYMKGLEESHGPPRLDVEGARVRPDWLYDFLQAPTTLRPWVKLRMPTFHLSEEETTTLVRYFAAAGRVSYPFVRPEEETQAYAHERERERPGYYETA
ncbi:MAG: c-type cytochrome, partial [Planctomycetes bacterium]|nr:c-type cytochrome [Planctomycetota bacterium]